MAGRGKFWAKGAHVALRAGNSPEQCSVSSAFFQILPLFFGETRRNSEWDRMIATVMSGSFGWLFGSDRHRLYMNESSVALGCRLKVSGATVGVDRT